MTVRELIAVLSAQDLDATVGINDADTNWVLNLTKIEVTRRGYVELSGDYTDTLPD